MITQDFTKPIDSATVLQKIVLDKAQWVKAKETEFPLSQFKENIQKSDRSFYDALAKGTHQKSAYILECIECFLKYNNVWIYVQYIIKCAKRY